MSLARAKVAEGGRILIPADLRRELGLTPGTELTLEAVDGELRVRSLRQALERAQALVRRHVPGDVSLSDELIRERHQAAVDD
jgi:AbrB family looped-hinge helix DNA binding protein